MNAYLFTGLELGPVVIERLVEQIPAARYDETTDPERFTIREEVAHMADWEPILRDRIVMAVQNPGTAILGIDESERATEMGYRDMDVREQLDLFKRERAKTIAYLRSLAPEDWNKTIDHNQKGLQTVSDQANQLVGHDMYHVEHLTQYTHEKVAGTW